LRRRVGADSIDIDTRLGYVRFTLAEPERIDFASIEKAADDAAYTLTGLTLETVSRQMRALEKAGLIAMPLPTRVRVLDAVALHELTGDAPARVAA